MVQCYLDAFTVHLRGYDGYPLPENLNEVFSLTISVGEQLDLDQLTSDVREVVKEQPHRIQQTYRETRWGASSNTAELIIEISGVLSGVGGLAAVWALIRQSALRHGEPRILSGETSAAWARTTVAGNLNINADSIRVIGIEPVGDGHRINLETPTESFTVEVDSNGVSRMTRT
jgi:hypothetical protein